MILEIKGVHYELTAKDRQLVEKKLKRIEKAKEDIVSLHLNFIQEKKEFKLEAMLHFRWGHQFFVHVNDYNLHEGIDKLFDKVTNQITKEKERIKEH